VSAAIPGCLPIETEFFPKNSVSKRDEIRVKRRTSRKVRQARKKKISRKDAKQEIFLLGVLCALSDLCVRCP
jgi:hypothetical protein